MPKKGLFLSTGFGIKKLQITLVVEDDKVSLEELQEKIEEFDEYVQSTDIVCIPFLPST
jgi:elongation factor 1-beta